MTTVAPRGLTDRSVAPDLARGAMLLLIAIANSSWYLYTAETRDLSSHPIDGSLADRIAQSIAIIAVDGRTYPMFAFLFGYGIWQLYSRQLEAGVDRKVARKLLRRRHLWMLVFGFVHAALLWMGDIVGAYGLAGLILVWLFIDRRDATIKIWAWALGGVLVATTLVGVVFIALVEVAGVGAEPAFVPHVEANIAEENYLISIAQRIAAWALLTPAQGLVGLVVPIAILIAIVAARHRVLEHPGNHLPLLRKTAVIGIATGWIVGAIGAAQFVGLLGLPSGYDLAFSSLLTLSGLMCGIGYVAAFGLIAARMHDRASSGRIAFALQAVGKRSLSLYLAQSLIFAPVMAAWGLGLGARLTSWSIILFAIATWLLTVGIAVVLEKRGMRGPAERLLRWLAYPR